MKSHLCCKNLYPRSESKRCLKLFERKESIIEQFLAKTEIALTIFSLEKYFFHVMFEIDS